LSGGGFKVSRLDLPHTPLARPSKPKMASIIFWRPFQDSCRAVMVELPVSHLETGFSPWLSAPITSPQTPQLRPWSASDPTSINTVVVAFVAHSPPLPITPLHVCGRARLRLRSAYRDMCEVWKDVTHVIEGEAKQKSSTSYDHC
jgi:hypothetical protein